MLTGGSGYVGTLANTSLVTSSHTKGDTNMAKRAINNPLRVMAYIHEAFAEGSEPSDPFFRIRVGSGQDAHEASVSRDGETVAFARVSGPTVNYEVEMETVENEDGEQVEQVVTDDDGNTTPVVHSCYGLDDAVLQLLNRAGIEGSQRAARFYADGPTDVDRVIAAGQTGGTLEAIRLMQELGVTVKELEEAKA